MNSDEREVRRALGIKYYLYATDRKSNWFRVDIDDFDMECFSQKYKKWFPYGKKARIIKEWFNDMYGK